MRWRWLLWLLWHLWLRAVEPAFVGLAVAANGTAYYAADVAPRFAAFYAKANSHSNTAAPPKAPPPSCIQLLLTQE